MTMTNHILTGSILAKFLPLPIAIPLAFLSHFVLDSLPHFGIPDFDFDATKKKHKKLWGTVLILDMLLTVALSIWLIASGHLTWWLVGLVAYSPDLIWVYQFIVHKRIVTQQNRLTRFHSGIQKYERIWGGAVEVVYGLLLFIVIRRP
jgi:hypothetical protein